MKSEAGWGRKRAKKTQEGNVCVEEERGVNGNVGRWVKGRVSKGRRAGGARREALRGSFHLASLYQCCKWVPSALHVMAEQEEVRHNIVPYILRS